jgi:dipeptidase E
VRLYLSSFRMGDHPEHLAPLVGDSGRRAVVIANAMDDAPADIRQAGVERELDALGALGFDAAELDLRDYFDAEERLRGELAGVALAWLRGGNVFMLRYALRRSGGDTVFCSLLADDALVYAGYSAGPCAFRTASRRVILSQARSTSLPSTTDPRESRILRCRTVRRSSSTASAKRLCNRQDP